MSTNAALTIVLSTVAVCIAWITTVTIKSL